MRRKNTPNARKIARERIINLFSDASKAYSTDPSISNKAVGVARRLGMKYNLRIPTELRRSFCKHCYHYLKHGKNVRVRRTEKGIVYTCLDCSEQMRFVLPKD